MYGFSSVTSTGLFSIYDSNLSLFASTPSTKLAANIGKKFFNMSVESSTHFNMPGNMTFNSNWPAWAAIATETSLPIILKHIMLRHSASDGLTLPGIIDEPACTVGIRISAKPAVGPDAISRISYAILLRSIARLRSADEQFATSYLLWRE